MPPRHILLFARCCLCLLIEGSVLLPKRERLGKSRFSLLGCNEHASVCLIRHTREIIFQYIGHQVDNVSNIDARSVETMLRVTNSEGLITSMVQDMREEQRSREAIAAMAAESVNSGGQAQTSETSRRGLADPREGVREIIFLGYQTYR